MGNIKVKNNTLMVTTTFDSVGGSMKFGVIPGGGAKAGVLANTALSIVNIFDQMDLRIRGFHRWSMEEVVQD